MIAAEIRVEVIHLDAPDPHLLGYRHTQFTFLRNNVNALLCHDIILFTSRGPSRWMVSRWQNTAFRTAADNLIGKTIPFGCFSSFDIFMRKRWGCKNRTYHSRHVTRS